MARKFTSKLLKRFEVNREHCDAVELRFFGYEGNTDSPRLGFYEIWVHDPDGTYYDGENMDSLETHVPIWECITGANIKCDNVVKMYARAKALATRA